MRIGGLLDRPEDALPDTPELKDELDDPDELLSDENDPVPADEEREEDEATEETDDLAETEEPAIEPGDACAEEPVDETRTGGAGAHSAARADATTAAAHRGTAASEP